MPRPQPPLTIAQLAADPAFEAATRGPDNKPWVTREHQSPEGRVRVRMRTACRVVGCGTAYAPDGVCGYCRARVRAARAARAPAAA